MYGMSRNDLYSSSEVPFVVAPAVPDPKIVVPGTPTNSFNKAATAVGDVPSLLFDSKEDRGRTQHLSVVEEYARSRALTPVDGLAKGVLAFGDSLVKGITGVVTEPIKGAAEKGAEGFFAGVGKGLLGVVFKPIGGALELGGKIGEGFVNTPGTLAGLVRSSEYVMYGIPLLDSFENCKVQDRKHVFIKVVELLDRPSPATSLFVFGASRKVVRDLVQAFDQGLDPDLFTLDPHVATGLLVRYLELLPVPLIPENFHQPLNSLTIGLPAKMDRSHPAVKRVQLLLNQLPVVNKSVLAELCLMLRKYLRASGSGTIVLDHICLSIGRVILRMGPPENDRDTTIEDGEESDDDEEEESTSSQKEFDNPEQKAFVLKTTKLLVRFYCPSYLNYQLRKSEFSLD